MKRSHSATLGRVLVTGGAGFIGTHVVRQLVDAGESVRVLELSDAATQHLPPQIDVLAGDIREPGDVHRAVRGCHTVLHLAADPNLFSPRAKHFDQVNHQGTQHVLSACEAHGVQRVVHVSTESILVRAHSDGPITADTRLEPDQAIGKYCRSKLRAEQAAWDAVRRGQPVVIVNPSVPVGAGDRRQGPLTRMVRQFIQGQLGTFYLDGQINLIDVRDAAAGMCAAARRGRVGRRYLLANETWTIQRLFNTLSQLTGRRAPSMRVPYALALGFAFLEQGWCRHVTGRTPMATVTGVRLTRRSFDMDASACLAELKVAVHPVVDALKEMVQGLSKSSPRTAATELPMTCRAGLE